MSTPTESPRAPLWLALVGVPIGFASSLAGIGGGLFAVSLLHFAFRFDLRRSTGTALVLVLATTSAATATEFARESSALHWNVVFALIVGIAGGVGLGFVFSERVPERGLRAIFAIVLPLAALKLAFGGDPLAAVASDPQVTTSVMELAWVVLVGLAGGFVAPVLGVGGGLVMVPGIFFGLPHIGFDSARACSLAAGCVGALRSVALKARADRVSWRHGSMLAVGALVGAAAGVGSIDTFEGLVSVGRLLLALVLTLVGARFAIESLRAESKR